jgi:hypothetical protein
VAKYQVRAARAGGEYDAGGFHRLDQRVGGLDVEECRVGCGGF